MAPTKHGGYQNHDKWQSHDVASYDVVEPNTTNESSKGTHIWMRYLGMEGYELHKSEKRKKQQGHDLYTRKPQH